MSLISLDGYDSSLPEQPTARRQTARIQRSGGGVAKTDDYSGRRSVDYTCVKALPRIEQSMQARHEPGCASSPTNGRVLQTEPPNDLVVDLSDMEAESSIGWRLENHPWLVKKWWISAFYMY